jgi:hypothetical protein
MPGALWSDSYTQQMVLPIVTTQTVNGVPVALVVPVLHEVKAAVVPAHCDKSQPLCWQAGALIPQLGPDRSLGMSIDWTVQLPTVTMPHFDSVSVT